MFVNARARVYHIPDSKKKLKGGTDTEKPKSSVTGITSGITSDRGLLQSPHTRDELCVFLCSRGAAKTGVGEESKVGGSH